MNCHFKNIVFDGDADYIVSGYGFQEVDSIVDGGYTSTLNEFEVWVNGTVGGYTGWSSTTAGRFANSTLTLVAQTVTDNKWTNTALNAQTDTYLKLRSIDDNSMIEGFASDIGTAITCAYIADKIYYPKMTLIDTNQNGYDITVSTSGKLLINGTVVGSQT